MIQVGFKSDKGIKRINNEDAYFVMPEDSVYIIADGVGGNNAGEIASRTAVSVAAEYIRENPIKNITCEEDLRNYFMKCLAKANTEIYTLAGKYTENRGMATTMVLAYIAGKLGYIVNVGDSRAYLFRNGSLSQITEDHTYVNELLKSGVITIEEAENHSQKNVITRAVGAEPSVRADFFQTALEKDDILMLCSDGLYGEVDEQKLIEILGGRNTMSVTCTHLVDEAIRCGGRDNITVICLKI